MSRTLWLLVSAGLSMLIVLAITPVVIWAAAALRLVDSPDGGRRSHPHPVPRMGGIALYLAAAAVACAVLMYAAPQFVPKGPAGVAEIRYTMGVFLGSALLFLTGIVDDVRGITAGAKGAAQVLAALIAWYFGARFDVIALGYGAGVSIGSVGFVVLLFWIVGVTNAFNFIDGLNGLAGGVAIVALGALVVASIALGNFIVLVPMVALMGALLGFLRFNFPVARIFLGDSGSLSVGFLLAVLSLKASVNDYGAVLIAVPVLALAVPLLDGLLAILRRWLRHVPISGADARHIHHRILALGVSPSRTAVLLWGLAATMASLGLLLTLTAPYVASSIAILGLVGVTVILIYGTNLLSYHELIVAGEVLMTAPSRARRLISDQILAVDLVTSLKSANSVEDVATLISDSARQFGFLSMELKGESVTPHVADRILPDNWAWRLDYPLRVGEDGAHGLYVLSIWCSPEKGARPYGAERIARVIGPAILQWFEMRGSADASQVTARAERGAYRKGLLAQ